MAQFIQRTSINKKISLAMIAIASLFLLEFTGFYLSGQALLEGISNIHETEKLSRTITQLRQITDTLTDIMNRRDRTPQSIQDSRRAFLGVYNEAKARLVEAKTLSRSDPEYMSYLQKMEDAFHQMNQNGEKYFAHPTANDSERELLLGEQFSLEADEAKEKLNLAIEKRSNLTFEALYRKRYQPFLVAVLLTLTFVGLALLGGFIFARRFSQSIKGLLLATNEVSMGNLEVQAPILSYDEIGKLTHAFNSMILALHRSTVSSEYIETIIQSLPDPLFVISPDGETQRANIAASKFLKYSDEELKGKLLQSLFDHQDPGIRTKMRQMIDGQTLKDWETVVTSKSKGELPVLISASAIRDKSGKLSGFVFTLKDISERRELEEERRRAEKSQQILAEATARFSESIDYGLTLKHVVQSIVPQLGDWAVIRTLGADKQVESTEFAYDSKIAHSHIDLETQSPSVSKAIEERKSQIQAHMNSHSESSVVTPLLYGERILGAITLTSTNPSRQYTQKDLPLIEEIARRAAISIENATLYHEAQEAISLRDEFLSIASHELKTPLTSLFLQLQIFIREVRKSISRSQSLEQRADHETISIPKKAVTIVSNCELQVKKLSALLDELLDLTRIRIGKLQLSKENVDLGRIVNEVIGRFKEEMIQKSVTISLRIAQDSIGLWDPMRVEQVVSNLISNALKYGNGRPVLVTIDQDAAKQTARLTVIDQGMGIRPEMKERIFERFERAGIGGKKISGLGLGLYILRQIVEAHGGAVHVQSEVGKGACFTVELPLHHTA